MSPKNILITGATGQQGRALLDALMPKPDGPAAFHILALTRSSTSPTAKSLASEKHVTVVEGNLNSVGSVRKVFEDAKATGGIWGVFCVLAFPGLGAVADGEEKQGKVCQLQSLYIYLFLRATFRWWQTYHLSMECLSLFIPRMNEEAINMTMSKSCRDVQR